MHLGQRQVPKNPEWLAEEWRERAACFAVLDTLQRYAKATKGWSILPGSTKDCPHVSLCRCIATFVRLSANLETQCEGLHHKVQKERIQSVAHHFVYQRPCLGVPGDLDVPCTWPRLQPKCRKHPAAPSPNRGLSTAWPASWRLGLCVPSLTFAYEF